MIKSIDKHWSYGLFAATGSGTYSNKKFYAGLSPALEYNVFDYLQSQQKLFTISWFVSADHYDYADTTIYDKVRETIFQNKINVSLSVTQPWGFASISMQGSHYINDPEKNRLSLAASTDLRIFKGLYFNVFISYQLIHDQTSLPKEGVSRDEQLLHQKEIATSYLFDFYTGITYRFGSKYNNAVNPRLNSGG